MKFKYGDTVKRKEGMWKHVTAPVLEKFDKFTVTAYFADQQYPTVIFKESGSYQWDAAYFELAEEEKVKNKFAVGDKVISTKNTPQTPEGWIGYVETIIPESKYSIHASKEGSSSVLTFQEDELELLSVGKKEKFQQLKEEARIIFDGLVDQDHPFNRDDITPQDTQGIVKPDVINSPKHYAVFEQVEAIQVIASAMTQDQFYGYCLGNILKYRLRAGGKDDVMQELGKADKYQELFTKHKHLCKDAM